MLIPVGHHRTASVPAFLTNNVHFLRQKGVRGAHHGTDIQIVLPVLDRDVKIMAARVKVGDNRLHAPVTVLIHHIAAVALAQKLFIPMLTLGPLALPRTDANLKPGSSESLAFGVLLRCILRLCRLVHAGILPGI